MVKKLAFKILWHLSWKLGYSLQDRKITPLKPMGDDPRELPYMKDLPYAVLNLPMELGVGLRFFSLSGRYHPFVVALKEAARNEMQEESVIEVLKKYTQLFTLKTANDFLGLSDNEACFPNDSHPYEYTYPWSTLLPSQLKKITLDGLTVVNRRYGLSSDESLELAGASDEKVKIEASRLIRLVKSIKEKGFNPQHPDSLGGFVLVSGDQWRWYVHGGQHRASVLAALGYDTIPVCVRRIVRREDVRFWPNVQAGIFSTQMALTVFDKFFAAEPPPVAQDWVEFVDGMAFKRLKEDSLPSYK